jgi:hypothetical protein
VIVPQNVELTLAVVGNDEGLVIRTEPVNARRPDRQPEFSV